MDKHIVVIPCQNQLLSWYYVHTVQLGWYSAVSTAAAVEAGTHILAAVVPADVVSVPTQCAVVPRDVCPALWTFVSDAPLRCAMSRVLDPTQSYIHISVCHFSLTVNPLYKTVNNNTESRLAKQWKNSELPT